MIYEILRFLKHNIAKPIILPITKIKKALNYRQQFDALKQYVDVRTLKPAIGEARVLQLANLEFTREIISKLEKNDIKPFMIAGTLLGAERHNGYIPWDDDIDFGLIRKDYDKLLNFAKENYIIKYQKINRYKYYESTKKRIADLLKKYPNQVIFLIYPFVLKAIKGTQLKDFVQIDFFPFDFYKTDYTISEHIRYLKKLKAKQWNLNNTIKEVDYLKKEHDNNPNIVLESDNIFFGIDNIDSVSYDKIPVYKKGWMKKDDFFPLKKMRFENAEFLAPKNHITYLENFYGKYWNNIPDDITPKHALERL